MCHSGFFVRLEVLKMSHRADFDREATVRYGGSGALPFQVRGIVPCRWVEQHVISRLTYPFDLAHEYITLDGLAPAGPLIASTAAGVIQVDYNRSDLVTVSNSPIVDYSILGMEFFSHDEPYYRLEVANLSLGPPPPPPPPPPYPEPEFWWQCKEGTGTIVHESYNNNHAVFIGSPQWSTDCPTLYSSIKGNNAGMLFAELNLVNNNGPWSIFFRMKCDPGFFVSRMFGVSYGYSSNLFNGVEWQVDWPAGGVRNMPADQRGNWRSWCIVKGPFPPGSNAQLYLDGLPVGAVMQLENSPIFPPQGTRFLGQWGPGYLNDLITDMRSWNVALTAPDVAAVHADIGPWP